MRKKVIILLFIFFIGLEVMLRVSYGTPPYELDPPNFKYYYVDTHKKYFRKIIKGNKHIYIPQRRENNAIEFAVAKPHNTARIFIIGGSVAAGWNYLELKKSLENLFPQKNFEVINCAIGGYDSYIDYLVVKEILSYQPDIIFVFSGNNEGNRDVVKINIKAYYANKFLRKAWIYRLLQDAFGKWRERKGLLYKRDIKKRLIDYEGNLRNMVRAARKKEVPILLCTLPYNLRDYPPTARRLFDDKEFIMGCLNLDSGKYADAINKLNNFLSKNPDGKLGTYFLGRAYDKMGDCVRAKEYYLKALELDCFNGRVSPRSNEIVRRICREEGAGTVDLEKAFMESALCGLPGRAQFIDNCHWWPDYNCLVTELAIKQACSIFPGSSLSNVSYSCQFLSLEERGVSRKNIIRLLRIATWELVLTDARNSCERVISLLETCYLMNPDAFNEVSFLKEDIKSLITLNQFENEIVSYYSNSLERDWSYTIYCIGELHRRSGNFRESLTYFDEAIIYLDSSDQNYYLPFVGKALVYYALDEKDKARENIEKAEKLTEGLGMRALEVKNYRDILGL